MNAFEPSGTFDDRAAPANAYDLVTVRVIAASTPLRAASRYSPKAFTTSRP